MSETRPILIVGAGPVGMTAAMELSRFGIPVRLVDKLPAPATTSRAIAVHARTLELMTPRGPGREMVQAGNRAVAVTLYGDGKHLGRIDLALIRSRYNFVLLLSQAETERLLREQLARQGVAVERGTEMIAFAQLEPNPHAGQRGGVRAVLRNDRGVLEEVEAAYVVCTEGAHSTVRHTVGLPFDGRSLSESYVLADLHVDGDLPDDELTIFTTAHGFLAAFPLGNRRFRLIITDPEKHGRDAPEPTLAEVQRLYDADTHVPARLHDVVWSSRFWINSRMIRTLRAGNIFFGGDSAHVHSPAGGQGMNTGIQDMVNLGWKLALVWQGKAAPELLDTYEQDRLPVIHDVVTRTETATDVINSRNALVHGLVTHLAPVFLGRQFVQGVGTGVISEVAAHYRASPLSHTEQAHGKLRAGDRVPDVEVLAEADDGDGTRQASSLHACFDPSRFTLLVANGGNVAGLRESLRPWEGLVDTRRIASADPDAAGSFSDLFGTGQNYLLVRPDGYLGFVGESWPALMEWLGRWLPAVPIPQ